MGGDKKRRNPSAERAFSRSSITPELMLLSPGAIPDHLAPIVERLGLNRSNWVETVRGFGRLFKQAAGNRPR
jgi:hypothetical protein